MQFKDTYLPLRADAQKKSVTFDLPGPPERENE